MHWISTTGSIYDSTLNWSATSGGPHGTTVPGPTDTIIFDSNGPGSCLLNAPVNVAGFHVQPDWHGVLLQQQYPITIGTDDASFAGGLFNGSFAPITIFGNLYIGSVNFVNTSNTMTLYGGFVFGSPYPPEQTFTQQEYTITHFDATNQTLWLIQKPLYPTEVALNMVEGAAQEYSEDYYVNGFAVKWDGKDLENQVSAGDDVRLSYVPEYAPGNFYHNNGTFKLKATGNTFKPNGALFYDFIMENDMTPAGYSIIDQTSTVQNDFFMTSGYMKQGTDSTFHAQGDVYVGQNFGTFGNDHQTLIEFSNDATNNIFVSGGIMPKVMVDKTTSHQVKFFGDTPLYVNGDFLINDGTVNTRGVDLKVGTA